MTGNSTCDGYFAVLYTFYRAIAGLAVEVPLQSRQRLVHCLRPQSQAHIDSQLGPRELVIQVAVALNVTGAKT